MRARHFNTLQPVCPVCRPSPEAPGAPLRLAHVTREENEHILEGVIHCSNNNCLREFPIVDGIPLLIADIRQYVAANILAISGRQDFSELIDSMLGDCCGPHSLYDQTRQHLSSYTWDHYADLDPLEPVGTPRPGAMLATLETGCRLAQPQVPGPVIDIGCAVGRSSFALAAKCSDLVLGVDLNFAMLRVAAGVLRHGTVRYPRRRVGMVYEQRVFPVQFANADNVDFWACDALALPFVPGSFALATGMNVLDCVTSPRDLLASIGRVLIPDGRAILVSPYDWSPNATPVEGWLGGHSQRAPGAGGSESVLRTLLTPGAHPASINTLQLLAECDDLPWHVRLHDRSTMSYRLHLAVAARTANH